MGRVPPAVKLVELIDLFRISSSLLFYNSKAEILLFYCKRLILDATIFLLENLLEIGLVSSLLYELLIVPVVPVKSKRLFELLNINYLWISFGETNVRSFILVDGTVGVTDQLLDYWLSYTALYLREILEKTLYEDYWLLLGVTLENIQSDVDESKYF